MKTDIMYEAKHLTTVNDYGKKLFPDVSFKVHSEKSRSCRSKKEMVSQNWQKLGLPGLMESTKARLYLTDKM